MFELNKEYSYPSQANTYRIAKLILLLTLFTLPALVMGIKAWFGFWYVLVLVLGIPLTIWSVLKYLSISFIIDNDKIVINWGIIIKQSRTILLKNVQNIKKVKGPLASIFGVNIVYIWTASPGQTANTDTKNQMVKPDGILLLLDDDANWLSDFIAKNH